MNNDQIEQVTNRRVEVVDGLLEIIRTPIEDITDSVFTEEIKEVLMEMVET